MSDTNIYSEPFQAWKHRTQQSIEADFDFPLDDDSICDILVSYDEFQSDPEPKENLGLWSFKVASQIAPGAPLGGIESLASVVAIVAIDHEKTFLRKGQ